MAGHSRWAQIKHQKTTTDQKRGELFSKLLHAISVAAKFGTDPQFNPRLRTAIEKAREHNVPRESIERAIQKTKEADARAEPLILEAYGPQGAALIIVASTDNKNRTIAEVKKILHENQGKWAPAGSVRWAFEPPHGERKEWTPKFPHNVKEQNTETLLSLINALTAHPDIVGVYHNQR